MPDRFPPSCHDVPMWRSNWLPLLACGLALLTATLATVTRGNQPPSAEPAAEYTNHIRPLLTQYCLTCHSRDQKKGDLDLERFTSIEQLRKDLRPWQAVLEALENGEMPPKKKPQPRPEERQRLVKWVRGFLDAEARARAGDPGRVVVRRLSNAEYNSTIRDLTGIDLQPARDFPVDGAAGEGFTNTGDALVTSPTLLNKYLNAAKEIADHAVLLPDGFRFSPAKTRRDWTDEMVAELRKLYASYPSDGKLPLAPYLTATVRFREELAAGKTTLNVVAMKEKLNPKYLQILWQALNDSRPSFPLERLRSQWRQAKVQDVGALLAEISAWQAQVWTFHPIGSYRYEHLTRQEANHPTLVESQTLRLKPKPAPGQTEVVLYLTTRSLSPTKEGSHAVWQRPRFEGGKQAPLMLRDIAQYAGQFEVDYRALFADTAKHLSAAVEVANDPKVSVANLARKHGLEPLLLQRWIDLLAVQPLPRETPRLKEHWKKDPLPLQLLTRKLEQLNQKPAINGWLDQSGQLPAIFTNSSNQTEAIPGTVAPHQVTVHPMPDQFVAVSWTSPLDGPVRLGARVAHAHPACGNGITWWLEHRRAERFALLDGGLLDLGKKADVPAREMKIHKGDEVVLAIGARELNHSCDLTAVDLTITELDKPGRVWDLARDVADTILEGNPHADKLGNKDVWRFVKGPDPTAKGKPVIADPAGPGAFGAMIPAGSLLAQWRGAAADPERQAQLSKLAEQVQVLLTGNRPAQEKHPDRIVYDNLVSLDSPLLRGIDLPRLAKAPSRTTKDATRIGLDKARFGKHPLGQAAEEASLVVPEDAVLEVRLPAGLFRDHEFVVEAKLGPAGADRVVQFQVLTAPPRLEASLTGNTPCLAASGSAAARQLLDGLEEFRRCFPAFICYPRVIPDDEVVCLKLYHREDEPLNRLFLDDEARKRFDRAWAELRFISQWPLTENKQLPLFIGFVTQDQPKELVAYFESQREPFRQRAQEFEQDLEAAIPKQLAALTEFAARAYRRPLEDKEKAEITQLYRELRKKDIPHGKALRGVLTRVLIAPSFLFRIERAALGKEACPVSDWELATRLSYFLWSSVPDAELRQVAASGSLHDGIVLSSQVARMLKDPKTRGLATEFGTQWLHVRDIQDNREKNEKLFPTFDDKLRSALFEEAVLFFEDLFQNGGSMRDLLDADHSFLNETLARHYGISNVAGAEWRRVQGVKKYGRGGVLALGSVLTKQSGASRTSPVLRGNWVVETLLGEKLPKPPANVPKLPEEEAGGDGLTVRQLVEKHAHVADCAVCHQRIDPFGFALEKFDTIGRFRAKDLGGRPIDTRAKLRDGTQFDGIDGLRHYLLTQRREDFLRHFCKKLLGYALGRSVTLSDQPLLEEMIEELKKNDYRLEVAVQTIVQSKQFRCHRGLEATKEEIDRPGH